MKTEEIKTMKDGFIDLTESVFPEGLPDDTLTNLRNCFYSGGIVAFKLTVEALTKDSRKEAIDAIQEEFAKHFSKAHQ
jgi:hypothetical protein